MWLEVVEVFVLSWLVRPISARHIGYMCVPGRALFAYRKQEAFHSFQVLKQPITFQVEAAHHSSGRCRQLLARPKQPMSLQAEAAKYFTGRSSPSFFRPERPVTFQAEAARHYPGRNSQKLNGVTCVPLPQPPDFKQHVPRNQHLQNIA